MDYVIKTSHLTKSYKNKTVVDGVSLHVKRGEIYGCVGPNGAGKSTIMKMLLNLIPADSGEIYLFGEKLTDRSYECLKRMGSIIENPYFYDRMTARQNLEMYCDYMGYHNRERIGEVLEEVSLHHAENKPVSQFSLGMKQRLAIARAILTKPELLILDEPINALDPEGIREMRRLFQRLSREQGVTIFISSHILSEVEQIADSIGILSGGKLQKEVSMEEIHGYLSEYLEIKVDDVDKAAALLEQSGRIVSMKVLRENRIQILDAELSAKELAELLVRHGVGLEELMQKQGTLEEYFFHLTEEAK